MGALIGKYYKEKLYLISSIYANIPKKIVKNEKNYLIFIKNFTFFTSSAIIHNSISI